MQWCWRRDLWNRLLLKPGLPKVGGNASKSHKMYAYMVGMYVSSTRRCAACLVSIVAASEMLTVPRARACSGVYGALGMANGFVNAQFNHNDSSSFHLLVSLPVMWLLAVFGHP